MQAIFWTLEEVAQRANGLQITPLLVKKAIPL